MDRSIYGSDCITPSWRCSSPKCTFTVLNLSEPIDGKKKCQEHMDYPMKRIRRSDA
ncbi:MAG: hypothetical protein ABIR91_02910 [Candidatus Saccharimonadales bacterium]